MINSLINMHLIDWQADFIHYFVYICTEMNGLISNNC